KPTGESSSLRGHSLILPIPLNLFANGPGGGIAAVQFFQSLPDRICLLALAVVTEAPGLFQRSESRRPTLVASDRTLARFFQFLLRQTNPRLLGLHLAEGRDQIAPDALRGLVIPLLP